MKIYVVFETIPITDDTKESLVFMSVHCSPEEAQLAVNKLNDSQIVEYNLIIPGVEEPLEIRVGKLEQKILLMDTQRSSIYKSVSKSDGDGKSDGRA